MGESRQYDYLLGMSGRIFKVIWRSDSYFGRRRDVSTPKEYLESMHDFTSIKAALDASGYRFEALVNKECVNPVAQVPAGFSSATKAEMRQAILRCIGQENRPAVALMQLNDGMDWRIITGYSANGDQIRGWSGLYGKDVSVEGLRMSKDRTFAAEKWEERVAVLLNPVGSKIPDSSQRQRALAKKALELAIANLEPLSRDGNATGLSAYDTCISMLHSFNNSVPDDLVVNNIIYMSAVFLGDLASDRATASAFLATMAKGWYAAPLYYAAGNCAKIHGLIWDCWKIAGGYWRKTGAEVPKFRNPENRKNMAKIVKEIKRLDENTMKEVKQALADWDKNFDYYMQSK